MNKTKAGVVCALVVTAAVFACNAGCAAWGYTPQLWQTVVTLVYILFWAGFTALAGKCRPWRVLTIVLALVTFVSGAGCLVLRLTQTGGFLSAFLSVFASVPFYGLTRYMGWTAAYAIVAVLGFGWVLWCFKRKKYNKKEDEQWESGA